MSHIYIYTHYIFTIYLLYAIYMIWPVKILYVNITILWLQQQLWLTKLGLLDMQFVTVFYLGSTLLFNQELWWCIVTSQYFTAMALKTQVLNYPTTSTESYRIQGWQMIANQLQAELSDTSGFRGQNLPSLTTPRATLGIWQTLRCNKSSALNLLDIVQYHRTSTEPFHHIKYHNIMLVSLSHDIAEILLLIAGDYPWLSLFLPLRTRLKRPGRVLMEPVACSLFSSLRALSTGSSRGAS
jgi:hypothetical protein